MTRYVLMKRLAVTSILILTGCSGLRSAQSEYDSSKEFVRKAQCATYASKEEQEFRDADRELGGKPGDTLLSVERSFYSSKRNSCVCILRTTTTVPGQRGLLEILQTVDTLTQEELESKTYSDDGHGLPRADLQQDVEQQVNNLK